MNEIVMGGVESEDNWRAALVADFDQHKSADGRVEWNVTGDLFCGFCPVTGQT